MNRRCSILAFVVLSLCLVLGACTYKNPEEGFSDYRNEDLYWTYAISTAQYYQDSLNQFLEQWRNDYKPDPSGHFKPSAVEMYLAALYANLYEGYGKDGHENYLELTKTICLRYGEYKSLFLPQDSLRPEYQNGVPTVPDFFQIPKYAHACEVLLQSTVLSAPERLQIEEELAQSADFLMITQEWGPMNRAMLRAEGLLYIAKLLPEHDHTTEWTQMGEAILADNLQNWSIEDAGMYGMIWMYSLSGYAHYVAENDELLNTPMVHYYMDYYKELICPAGVIPDYGDAWWRSWWYASVPVFELGAKSLNDPELKWAAQYTFEKNVKRKGHSVSLALKYLEAATWADPNIDPKIPSTASVQVLDDQIGKKVVFRNGRDTNSTYLLLNYKDQGTDGWLYREHLRNTLSVSHEKMHHGHSDENSIAFWMHNNSILLRDGGYRDAIPSGENGSYRADIFHNRLVGRNSQPEAEQRIIDFLKNDGFYKEVATQKIDFYTSNQVDHSRTRLVDEEQDFIHDRIVDYVKEENFFVVTDIVEVTENGPFTFSTLWHSQHVLDSGANWIITRYDSIGKWKNPGSDRLYMQFLQPTPLNREITEINRHRQQEHVISNTQSQYFRKGEKVLFVSVLMPLGENDALPKEEYIDLVKASENTLHISITLDDKRIFLAHKIDLSKDLVREWPKPRYTADTGTMRIGDYATDAQSFSAVETQDQIHIAAANTTTIKLGDQIIFQQPSVTNEYRLDGGEATAAPWKVRLVERTIQKN